jgi:hypothetical protein
MDKTMEKAMQGTNFFLIIYAVVPPFACNMACILVGIESWKL